MLRVADPAWLTTFNILPLIRRESDGLENGLLFVLGKFTHRFLFSLFSRTHNFISEFESIESFFREVGLFFIRAGREYCSVVVVHNK